MLVDTFFYLAERTRVIFDLCGDLSRSAELAFEHGIVQEPLAKAILEAVQNMMDLACRRLAVSGELICHGLLTNERPLVRN